LAGLSAAKGLEHRASAGAFAISLILRRKLDVLICQCELRGRVSMSRYIEASVQTGANQEERKKWCLTPIIS
jgi:hypothetical protein